MSSNSGNQTVIVGAGPAGLTAALTLARYRHPVVLVDSHKTPRNGAARGVHGHIGLDGVAPTEIRARAWKELSQYATVELVEAGVASVRAADDDRFQVGLDNGDTIDATTMLLATGVVDVHPANVEGFSACWGRTVIHCPLCLGEENAGRTWGHVTDNAQIAGLSAAALKAWSDDVIIICPESMPGIDETRATAHGLGCDVITGTIRSLHHNDGSLHAVEFDDGRVIERGTLVWTPQQKQVPFVSKAIDELKLNADDAGFLAVDDRQRTNVPGVFAAGDLASRWNQSFTLATSTGLTAAETIHATSVFRALGMPMPDAPSYGE
uniref:Thioredoxin reductase n=1 Tax=uncultured bacterium esnapd9 TaxID=1366616 RepID=S5TKU1_9BACT|nr:thioredoxin reductase [uncultured bacterium esnapd9]